VSAKETFHKSVKRALQKEQWVITAEPLKFKFGNVNFQVDLGAERLVAAERAGEKIAVEIKSFLNPSAITDFYAALGQFLRLLSLNAFQHPQSSRSRVIPFCRIIGSKPPISLIAAATEQ